jgi:hypothetical protein
MLFDIGPGVEDPFSFRASRVPRGEAPALDRCWPKVVLEKRGRRVEDYEKYEPIYVKS